MTVDLFARGRLVDVPEETLQALMERAGEDPEGLTAAVGEILQSVRSDGDAALLGMARRFDGVELTTLEIPKERWTAALAALDPPVREALERAARNIHRFHAAQVPDDVILEVEEGVRITRTTTPLETVGVYAPGGRAAYPSSVLMGVVPAKAVGVDEVVVCSPPGPQGAPPTEVLAACAIAGADRLFAVGGAGAIAALAFGTETIPVVDAVVGPGNQWVTEAKRQVAGRVLIDSPAGPSEVLIVADANARADLAAHELLAQAEHDPAAACVLITDSPELAIAVERELGTLLAATPRAEIAQQSLARAGAILVTDTIDTAFAFAQAWAPEHLSIMTAGAAAHGRTVTTAGTTFVGPSASVAFGDYLTGANHVLPTAGRARSFSGLSAQHFLRSYTIQEITPAGAAAMAADVGRLADEEGLPAHAAAARARGTS